ncbi:TonB-dependent receptor [Sodalis sp. RH15]|uniref:TonB-dependent receptor n=1 Tax=Sodalis sp. RH15 TaxID=3394330 RepID=UPI0039B51850
MKKLAPFAAVVITAMPLVSHAAVSNIKSSCSYGDGGVDNVADFLQCGTVSGSLRTLYYSSHNTLFVTGKSQDTVSYGGNVKYETAPLYGFRAALGGVFLRGIDHPDPSRTVGALANNQTNFGEAYLSWQHENFKITAGDQRINLPFASDYDFRVTPILFRGIDTDYGDKINFLHATKVWRYKPWATDQFIATSAYTNVTEPTNGMWAVGAGRGVELGAEKLQGQVWYESYDDYTNIFYSEGHLRFPAMPHAPEIGAQFIRGTSEGRALAGKVDNTSYGLQFGLAIIPRLEWKLNYDHIAASPNSWKNGALVAPYAHSASSGSYFAQPFFTSTEDLGSGNAYSTNLSYRASEELLVGTRYSFMDLKPSAKAASINQSEYLVYFTWKLTRLLKGLSLTDSAGVQTSSSYDKNFWQNRLAVQYDF